MPPPTKQVSEAISTALHTETVLYVITQYTRQRALRQQQLLEQQKQLEDHQVGGGGGAGGAPLTSLDMMPLGDIVFHTLESMGVHTGMRLCERLTAADPLTNFTPEVVSKFISGQVWRAMFGKGLDHRYGQGITRLTDNNFKWFRSNTFKRFRPTANSGNGGNSSSPRGNGPASRGPSPSRGGGAAGKPAMGGFRNVTNTLHAAPGHNVPGKAAGMMSGMNSGVEGPSESQPMSPASNSPWDADCGPADFAVYAAGVIKGVLQSLGHPHVAVSFELSGEETTERNVSGTAVVGDNGGSGGGGANEQQQQFSYVGVKDITFVLDFTVEQAMLMME